MTIGERQVALRLAALHPADRAWLLGRIDPGSAARIRVMLRHPLVIAAAGAGIGPGDAVVTHSPMAEPVTELNVSGSSVPDTQGWDPSWAALLSDAHNLPSALAASVSRYRQGSVAESSP
jgi:hypothetical protein